MNTRAGWVVIAMLLIASPLALAQGSFSARALSLDGEATFSGDASGLLSVAALEGFSWEVTAEAAHVERLWVKYATLDPPGPVGATTFYDGQNEQQASDAYEAVRLVMTDVTPGGAILVLGTSLEGETTAPVYLTNARDPALDQNPPKEVDTQPQSDGSPDYRLREVLDGDYISLTTNAGDFVVAGDLEIRLYGTSYHLTSAQGEGDGQTGRISETILGPAEQGRVEVQTITLKNAVFTLRTLSPTTWLTPHASVHFQGEIVASEESASFNIPTLTSSAPGEYAGSATLQLSPSDRGVEMSSPVLMTAALPKARETPQVLSLVVIALGIIGLGVGIVAWRARSARGDDLELAILAMEERRWESALTHLDRLVAKRPQDATILMDRAICLEEIGRLGEARSGYERALRVEPHNAEAHYYYARTLARLRMATGAMAHLTRALSLDDRLAELARRESAFSSFADHPQFVGLVNR